MIILFIKRKRIFAYNKKYNSRKELISVKAIIYKNNLLCQKKNKLATTSANITDVDSLSSRNDNKSYTSSDSDYAEALDDITAP